jgi:hypothetical protein
MERTSRWYFTLTTRERAPSLAVRSQDPIPAMVLPSMNGGDNVSDSPEAFRGGGNGSLLTDR